jgi:TolB-like protein
VLEGGVRKAANRNRITAQPIEAATGAHLRAARFDGGLEDIFTLQDQVSASVAGTIALKMEQVIGLLSAWRGECPRADQRS